ncbi:hypothetical protein Ade02nite_33430 [Paractinoplanes deccanensis]|uniref:ROK family protein n=1 Tax=Paractinoplanes deccanensis TaxID=113561 RepID=A0ABQ3Y3X6_9ACTN|nr:ROK family protein [Actinoplanes deccanensis]GID74702.1 hypothetical protein Ade02nite_33430 [Actinoplanes deccanensis]
MTTRPAGITGRDLVLATVRDAGPISRTDLTRRTGMARETVNGLLTKLLANGSLAESDPVAAGHQGRPARLLSLGPEAGYVVGAVLDSAGVAETGRAAARVAVSGLTGEIEVERSRPLHGVTPAEILDEFAALITECVPAGRRVWHTVIGLPAPVADGVVHTSSVLPGWAGFAAGAELRRRLGHGVTVVNDANLSLLGEVTHGVARGYRDVCYLRIASGIGCGLLLDGELHRGANGVAGEIGHVQVDETGALCRCGNRGCLETIAAPRELLGALSAGYGEPVSAERALELAEHEAIAQRVLADAGRMIGRVVADLANTINPALVVVDGPLITEGGPIVAGVRESLLRYAQPAVAERTAIHAGTLAGRSALLGAVAAALSRLPGAAPLSRLMAAHPSGVGVSASGAAAAAPSSARPGAGALPPAAPTPTTPPAAASHRPFAAQPVVSHETEKTEMSGSGRAGPGRGVARQDGAGEGVTAERVAGEPAAGPGGAGWDAGVLGGASAGAVQRAGAVEVGEERGGSPRRRERVARRERIAELLRTHGALARSDVVRLTKLPRAAVVELLDEMCREGMVEACDAPVEQGRPGRPSPGFRLVTPAELLAAAAISAYGIRVIVADGAGRVLHQAAHPVPMTVSGEAPVRLAGELIASLLAGNGHAPGDLREVALSVPAPVDPVTGRFGTPGILPMFSGFAPAEVITEVLGVPCRVENNADLAALAEVRRGAAQGALDVLYLRADQYTGAGIVAGGRMYRGALGYAGEVGHLNVREVGPLCVCGSRGCLSTFLSPASFGAVLDAAPFIRESEDPQQRLMKLAAGGHRPAQRALLDAGRLIGRSIAPLTNMLNPAVVVVGGKYGEAGPHVEEGIRESLMRHCTPAVTAGLSVVSTALRADAEVLGAIESLLPHPVVS